MNFQYRGAVNTLYAIERRDKAKLDHLYLDPNKKSESDFLIALCNLASISWLVSPYFLKPLFLQLFQQIQYVNQMPII